MTAPAAPNSDKPSFWDFVWIPAFGNVGMVVDQGKALVNGATGAVADALTPAPVDKALSYLSSKTFWIRVGVGAAGAVLIIIGIVVMVGKPAVDVGKTVVKAVV